MSAPFQHSQLRQPLASTRRGFLKCAAAAALTPLHPASAHSDTPTTPPIPKVRLGRRLDNVPLLGIGTGVRASNRSNALGRKGEAHFIDTIQRAYAEGVRLFDCADSYGSLPLTAKALRSYPRDSYVLVTKVWLHPGGIPAAEPRHDTRAAVERFLREAATDYLDLVQLHCLTAQDWNQTLQPHMEALSKAREQGWIRAHGCSCHSLDALKTAAAEPWVDVVHARINPWGVKMDAAADIVVPVLRAIHESDKGVIGMKLLGEGAFRDDSAKIDESLRFVLGLGCVDVLIAGFETSAELVDYKQRTLRLLPARLAERPGSGTAGAPPR